MTPQTLAFIDFQATLSTPFLCTATLYSEDPAVDLEKLLRTSYTVKLPLPDGSTRPINGLITRAERGETTTRSTRYTYEIRPWFWLLGQQRGCALFQDMTTPNIIKKVCQDAGFTHIKDSLTKTYTKREYTAQYNENSLDFLSRLMAEEGIFYFFTHTESTHTLVLADAVTSLAPCTGCATLSYVAGTLPGTPSVHMQPLSIAAQSLPQSCSVDDYNFLTPTASLLGKSGTDKPSAGDFGTGHTAQQDGETLAGKRQDAFDAEKLRLHAVSAHAGLYPGGTATIKGCPQKDLNKEWLITETEIHVTGSDEISVTFSALPKSVSYAPMPIYARPRLHGPLTGTVTGKSGEEVWTDKHGRVKVRLHWDHVSKTDETASCWMRVTQPWSGTGYGAMFVPRVGQEVVVSFLDGDPNRPLVTGMLYNATNTPPWPLPGKAAHSGIKGHSMPKGKGEGNEICLDDTADKERLYFHAQKLLECLVEDGRSTIIKGEGGDTLTIEKGDLKVTVTKGKADYTVKGDYNLNVDGNLSIKVKGDISIKSDKGTTLKAGKDITIKPDGGLTAKSGKAMSLDAGTTLAAKSKTSLNIAAGSTGEVKASAVLTLKGAMVKAG